MAVPGQAPEFPADAIEVGRVLGAYGLQGWIRVQPFASEPQALFSSRRWFVLAPEPPGPAHASYPPLLRITHSRSQGDSVVAAAQELPDRTAAEAMRGCRIFIGRSSFPTAGDGEYYWIDLIGLAVKNRDGIALGEVIGLIDTGVHSVLRLRRPDAPADAKPDQAERLIPFVAAYIDEVDIAARCISVDWGVDY